SPVIESATPSSACASASAALTSTTARMRFAASCARRAASNLWASSLMSGLLYTCSMVWCSSSIRCAHRQSERSFHSMQESHRLGTRSGAQRLLLGCYAVEHRKGVNELTLPLFLGEQWVRLIELTGRPVRSASKGTFSRAR